MSVERLFPPQTFGLPIVRNLDIYQRTGCAGGGDACGKRHGSWRRQSLRQTQEAGGKRQLQRHPPKLLHLRDSPRGVTFAFSANGMTPTQQLQVSVLLLLVSKCRNNQKRNNQN
jgi:hypothetical protein